MRKAFIEALIEEAEKDDRIWLLTADLGYSILEPFADRFPRRFLNVGVAEQNMIGVASGLAHSGKIVFVYSIVNFVTFRCLEQIRNDVAYHEASVKIVGVGAGMAYGPQGYTHHGLEDVGVMRLLPNMAVVVPADPVETRLGVKAIVKRPGPAYLRLGKAGKQVIFSHPTEFEIGKALTLCPGQDVALLCAGPIVAAALEAAKILSRDSIEVSVVDCASVQPMDIDVVVDAAKRCKLIVTMEDHIICGGLGTVVSEVVAQMQGSRSRVVRKGFDARASVLAGNEVYYRQHAGMTGEKIAEFVRFELNRKQQ